MTTHVNAQIPPHPAVVDSVSLRAIQLPLPAAPDPWHRPGKPQPCTASLKLSYSSAVAAAAADDVSLSLDYGKLYRRLEEDVRTGDGKEDVRLLAAIVANCGLRLLDETAAGIRRMAHTQTGLGAGGRRGSASSTAGSKARARAALASDGPASSPIDGQFGQCEVWLHLPKAHLRAEEGVKYRSVTAWGYRPDSAPGAGGAEAVAVDAGRYPVVLEEEFRIEGIKCYCILGVNSHERVEKQAVIISLEFRGRGQLAWGEKVIGTWEGVTRGVAEVCSLCLLCWPWVFANMCNSELRARLSRRSRHWRLSSRAL